MAYFEQFDIATNAPNGQATGTLSATGSVTLTLPAGTSNVAIELISSSFVGTIVFESSEDGGTTYNSRVYRGTGILNNLQTTLTNPSSGDWRGNSSGMTHTRVRCTAYTSGSLAVTINSTTGVGAVFLNAAIPIGADSTGNIFTATSISTGASQTGTYEDMDQVASIDVSGILTQNGTITFQFSADGSTLLTDISPSYPITANTAFSYAFRPLAKYFRVKVDNGGGSSATLDLDTHYRAVGTELQKLPNTVAMADNGQSVSTKSIPHSSTSTAAGGTWGNVTRSTTASNKSGMHVSLLEQVAELQNKSLSSASYAAVNVSTSATRVDNQPSLLTNRKVVRITNNDNNTAVYYGFDNAVTTGTGIPLGAGVTHDCEVDTNVTIYAIAASGTVSVRVGQFAGTV